MDANGKSDRSTASGRHRSTTQQNRSNSSERPAANKPKIKRDSSERKKQKERYSDKSASRNHRQLDAAEKHKGKRSRSISPINRRRRSRSRNSTQLPPRNYRENDAGYHRLPYTKNEASSSLSPSSHIPYKRIKADERHHSKTSPPVRNIKRETKNDHNQNSTALIYTDSKNRPDETSHHHNNASAPTQDSTSHSNTKNSTQQTQPEKPNFEPSGLLGAETSLKSGILLKHSPPADSRQPTKKWRLYMFKKDVSKAKIKNEGDEDDQMKVFHIHRQPSYLFGKETRVADIPLLHPTISKQHAVLQFRLRQGEVKPYIIDLDSTNGTYLNGERIEPSRYFELREQDTLQFGRSTRDFVLLHSASVEVEKIDYDEYLNSRETQF